MWFDTWKDIVRIVLVGTAAYAALVGVLRASGKRTLAKLNAFDFVVTVAFGSTLSTILLSTDVSFVEGTVALALLALLQYVVALLSARLAWMGKAVTARPTAVVREGRLLPEALAAHRLTADQIRQVCRGAGHGDLTQVAAVVLESDGTLSVISDSQLGSGWSLEDVT